MDGVAAPVGPGLVGRLWWGLFRQGAFAYGLDIPWMGDHLEGHILSVFLESPSPDFPFIALLASGGHTNLYYVKSQTDIECLGQTFDDAAGRPLTKLPKCWDWAIPAEK
ncbi:MAG: hypothetical protein R2861_03590 [Desulfobacterales bacterium]